MPEDRAEATVWWYIAMELGFRYTPAALDSNIRSILDGGSCSGIRPPSVSDFAPFVRWVGQLDRDGALSAFVSKPWRIAAPALCGGAAAAARAPGTLSPVFQQQQQQHSSNPDRGNYEAGTFQQQLPPMTNKGGSKSQKQQRRQDCNQHLHEWLETLEHQHGDRPQPSPFHPGIKRTRLTENQQQHPPIMVNYDGQHLQTMEGSGGGFPGGTRHLSNGARHQNHYQHPRQPMRKEHVAGRAASDRGPASRLQQQEEAARRLPGQRIGHPNSVHGHVQQQHPGMQEEEEPLDAFRGETQGVPLLQLRGRRSGRRENDVEILEQQPGMRRRSSGERRRSSGGQGMKEQAQAQAAHADADDAAQAPRQRARGGTFSWKDRSPGSPTAAEPMSKSIRTICHGSPGDDRARSAESISGDKSGSKACGRQLDPCRGTIAADITSGRGRPGAATRDAAGDVMEGAGGNAEAGIFQGIGSSGPQQQQQQPALFWAMKRVRNGRVPAATWARLDTDW